ncbi:hypothetical protein HPB51_012447 [Rhipicephalus microplus]|uniref:Reprolysin n=1 Tax=Rhipicephalus microplus TaxID=6941 RepID=A0A9J6E8V4_RHIMP|nr:hypothetical protein HPB51_012447 [Rhipicephalus microplus]
MNACGNLAFLAGLQKGQLVYPRLLEERSSEKTMVMQVHDELTLNLRKASVAAPTVRLITEEKGKTVTHYYNGEHVDRDLYEDEERIASVIVTKDPFGVHMDTSPATVVSARIHLGRFLAINVTTTTGPCSTALVTMDRTMALLRRQSAGPAVRRPRMTVAPDKRPITIERQLYWPVQPQTPPDPVYVEIFVVSDQNHHQHFTTNDAFLAYLCVMVNSTYEYVDLYQQNVKFAHDQRTLVKLKQYANRKKGEFGNPDAVYYMSGLGAPHDGDAPPSVGHPGSQSCPWDNGNIMSYVDKGPSHHRFSECSLRGMRHVIK